MYKNSVVAVLLLIMSTLYSNQDKNLVTVYQDQTSYIPQLRPSYIERLSENWETISPLISDHHSCQRTLTSYQTSWWYPAAKKIGTMALSLFVGTRTEVQKK